MEYLAYICTRNVGATGKGKPSRLRHLRNLLCILPKLGLVRKPNQNPEGISFIVAAKDEELWIEKCLLSILPVASEIIVVDSSTRDKTSGIVSSYAKEYSKIKHIRFVWNASNAFALSLNLGLANVSYRWAFKWDADFVARDAKSLENWTKRLSCLSRDLYYVIDVPRINLQGDLHHQPAGYEFSNSETRLFTWSPELEWKLKEGYWEQVMGDSIWGHRFPPWYKNLVWREPYIFHCDIKPPRRELERLFWSSFMIDNCGFATLEAYTKHFVKTEWRMSVEEAERKVVELSMRDLVEYDENRFGRLPELLRRTEKHEA